MARTANPLTRQIRKIRKSLAEAQRALAALSTASRSSQGVRREGASRRLTLSTRRRAALKIHGRYIGLMRNLSGRKKARVKAMKAAKGYGPAIALAERLTR